MAAGAEEQRTTPLELFFDLVFVFAVTQVSTLLSHDLSWAGFGRSMLVLALVWWAWSAFAWVVDASDPDAPRVRAVIFLSMVLAFFVALTVPQAFGSDAAIFAWSYAALRFVHIGFYWDVTQRGRAEWSAVAGFALPSTIGMALLVVGAELHGAARTTLWVAAAIIDYAGPLLTRRRLRRLQVLGVAHFAERYALFIIICLGESIVALGVGAHGVEITGAVLVGAALGLLVTGGMWWTYFDHVAAAAEERLRSMREAVLAASDAYSYLHLLMVAGIIAFAVGAKQAVGHAGDPLSDAARLALCGGVAAYLAGHVVFGLRLMGTASLPKCAAAAAVLAVYLVTSGAPAWLSEALLVAVLAALIAWEVAAERRRSAAPAG